MSELPEIMDIEYQSAVDKEIEKISNSDFEWLKDLELFQNHTFNQDGETYTGVLSYTVDKEMYSVTLELERKLLLGYRSFLAGFRFDASGKLYPISDELLYSND